MDDAIKQLALDVDRCCRLTGEFTLRSGTTSTEYFDKYLFESDPHLLRRVAEAMVPLVPRTAAVLGGLELGGVPLATVLGQIVSLPTVFVRKEAKEYGTAKLAEGPDLAGKSVVLIEDVITTGGAVRNAALALRALGASVSVVVCAINRSELSSRPLADVGIEIRSVLTKALLDSHSTG